ncbi:MAG: helix-turn-helix domain-containing protein [Gemmatimonadaceae bacterium]
MRITTATHDSALGHWSHSECEPWNLRGIVEKLWHFEGKTSLLRERSFPKVYSEIILHLGPRFRDVSACGKSLDFFPTACFAGPTTTPAVIEAPNEVCCVIGIQLTAAGAFQLLRTSTTCTLNCTLDVADSLSPTAAFIAEACYAAPTVARRFELICDWIAREIASSKPMHSAVAWAATEISSSHGTSSISRLQVTTALSKPRFVSLFREQVGLAPKQYARILRFRHSLSLLQQGHRLSDAALTAGYYDQAHMHRDFAEFAQRTPLEFVTAARFPNSLSIPE